MQPDRVDATERFRTLRKLGEGSTSHVFEVEDRAGGGRFALKRLRGERVSADMVARFKDEFRFFERISHPNLAKNYELVCDPTGMYVLMELVEGVDFLRYVRPYEGANGGALAIASGGTGSQGGARAQLLQAGGVLSHERLRGALSQLVSGLFALHAAGRVHCDIKPENVLVTSSGRVVVLDFGLATDQRHSRSARGTPAFMAPEHFMGQVGEAADWYSVGVLLYAALSGRLPITSAPHTLEHAKRFMRPIDPRIQMTGLPDDLVELALRLLAPEPQLRPTGTELARLLGVRPASALRASMPFVGRERELAELGAAFDRARRGTLQVVHVHGESGIGKTSLVQRWARAAEAQRGQVFRGACYKDASIPYKGLDSVMDHLATTLVERQVPIHAQERTALATMFPVFGPRREPGAELDFDQDPALLRARWVRAFWSVLARVLQGGALALWIDDLQWSDAESIDLLVDIVRSPAARGILIVLGYRSSAAGWGERVQHARKHLPCDHDLALCALDADAIWALVEAAGEADAQTLARIARESGGNPFFVGELLRARAAGYTSELPSLGAVLASRLDALSADQREFVELVAVAGRPLDEAIVRSALGASHEAALAARRTLVAASFLRMADQDASELEPYHDGIREHVLRQLSSEGSRAYHARLAEAYEAAGSADPETLALHFRSAGDVDKALLYTERAADAAVRALAFDHAAELYAAALSVASAQARPALCIKHARALSNAGRPSDAARAFLAALEFRPGEVELKLCAGDEFLRAGEIEAGLALLRDLAAAIGEPLPRTNASTLLSLLWKTAKLRRPRIRLCDEMRPDAEPRLTLCLTIARRLAMVDFALAALFQVRYLALALDTGSRADIAQGLALQACFAAQMPAFIAGGVPGAQELLERARELVRDSDSPLTRACVAFAPGAIAAGAGHWSTARQALEPVVELLREKTSVGLRWDTAYAQAVIVQMLWIEGRVPELRRRLHDYVREARGHLLAESMHALKGAAMLALCDDRPEQARAIAAEAIAPWSPAAWRIPHHFHCVALNEIDLYEGRPSAALARIRASQPHARKAGFHRIALYLLTDVVIRARTALALGMHDQATREIRLLEARPEGWAMAIGGALRACLAAARGEPAQALRALEQAIPQLERWELGLHLAAARYRYGQLSANGALERAAIDDLTNRGVRAPPRMFASLLPLP